ncbi:uncharacterized protein V1516DRAFT_678444 [Lipomyces oligophaga]|uniref:uncharacterized protein n=1 Tax=Lipomyces oligophaga TaxID=45792 RepID=UPI0034CF5691
MALEGSVNVAVLAQEPDLRSLSYISLDDNLVCPICRCALVDPCCTKCGHVFCSSCLQRALIQTPKCPVDRSDISDQDVLPPPKLLSNMVNELLVCCPNEELGCSCVLQRGLLRYHLSEDCQYSLVPCPGAPECSRLIQRRALKQTTTSPSFSASDSSARCLHNHVYCSACDKKVLEVDLPAHEAACTVRTVRCPDCSDEFTLASLATHSPICPDTIVRCTAEKIGCPWSGPRARHAAHATLCTFVKLAPFMARQEARIDALELENKGLRAQLCGSLSTLSTPQIGFDHDMYHVMAEHERFRSDFEKLSEQLGELEIRHSVLITNQNVRMKDELQSMRNAMNGIRHQIHFLLMERRTWALQNMASNTMAAQVAAAQANTTNTISSSSPASVTTQSTRAHLREHSCRLPRRDSEQYREKL